MRRYDLTYIVPSDVDDEEIKNVMAQVVSWVEQAQGKVAQTDYWGRRRLAYNISEYQEGHYVSLDLEMAPDATTSLERNLKLSGKVIRYLLVRRDD